MLLKNYLIKNPGSVMSSDLHIGHFVGLENFCLSLKIKPQELQIGGFIFNLLFSALAVCDI